MTAEAIAFSIVGIHAALLVVVSITAIYSRRKIRRDASIAVLKILVGYSGSRPSTNSHPTQIESSGPKPSNGDLSKSIGPP
jgi:hypothetical protein